MVRVVELPAFKQCTCYNCKAILEYSYNDIQEKFERDYSGCGETVYRIFCPNCGSSPIVSRWK